MELYDIIKNYVRKSSITYSIIKLDSSLTQEDLINEVYLKLYNKDNDFIYNKMKQSLLQIYNKIKIHKIEVSDFNYEDSEIHSIMYNDNLFIIEDSLNRIKNINKNCYICLYLYFIKKMTMREIASLLNVSFNCVKKRIDKGLQIIKDQM